MIGNFHTIFCRENDLSTVSVVGNFVSKFSDYCIVDKYCRYLYAFIAILSIIFKLAA